MRNVLRVHVDLIDQGTAFAGYEIMIDADEWGAEDSNWEGIPRAFVEMVRPMVLAYFPEVQEGLWDLGWKAGSPIEFDWDASELSSEWMLGWPIGITGWAGRDEHPGIGERLSHAGQVIGRILIQKLRDPLRSGLVKG